MGELTSSEREAVERAGAEPMLDQVLAWSAINSGSRNLAGLERMGEVLADAFSALPGLLRLEQPQKVDAVDAAGATQDLPHGRHLHLTVRPTAPLQLLFTGHMDTVFAADHAFQETRWLDEGVLNGPGVADMKGGLAVMLAALKAVEKSRLADRIGYEVVINSDEEVGSLASAGLLKQAAQGKRAALTYEPAALPDGTLAGARPGSGNFSFVIKGKSAHAGRNPEDGRNAVVAASELALRLSMSKTPGLSINPAKIDGGGPNNVVPDLAILRVNMRPRTGDDQEIAGRLIAKAVDETAKSHEVYIEVHGGFARPPKPLDEEAEALFKLVQAAGADLGQSFGWQPSGGVCDGNNIAACGVPVVDTMGVRGGKIHSMEEYLITESLAERAALSALTVLRLAGEAQ
ncbi:MAG TPA: hydrolase [Sphingomicrobium sp.]|jgi:glutamate carboxypeptidase